jgi:hypothetical protein
MPEMASAAEVPIIAAISGSVVLAGEITVQMHLHFVLEAFREQRADRTIDQARGQGFLLGRTAFTLEETAGDLAGCVGRSW